MGDADDQGERIGNIETVKYLGILSNFFELSRVVKDATGQPEGFPDFKTVMN